MRIISGKWKGKNLNSFKLATTRPTSDMIREALYDKIGQRVINAKVLDLFSGTGAVGIESISRGAEVCYFVDQNTEAIKIIKSNLALIGNVCSYVYKLNYLDALKMFYKRGLKFDIVFLDPPYASDFAENAIQIIIKNNLLADDALVVWEHDKFKLEYIDNNFIDVVTKKYGDKFLTYIYSKNIINIQK